MRKTNFTFNQRKSLRNKSSSKLLTSLLTAFFFLLVGVPSGLHAQCQLACTGEVQISLGVDGTYLVTVADALKNSDCDTSELEAIAYDANNQEIPGNLLDCSYHGATISIGVYDDNGNNCWTTAYVFDKMSPLIECGNDTLTCGEAIVWSEPTLTDNCSPPADITVEQVHAPIEITLPCAEDSIFTKMIIRTLRARDGNGNVTPDSLLCSDTIWVQRLSLDSIEAPVNQIDLTTDYLADSAALNCEPSASEFSFPEPYNWYDVDGNDYPDPWDVRVNVPSINGVEIDWPVGETSIYLNECNASIEYEDDVQYLGCHTKIFRTYEVKEWCGNTLNDTSFLHMIVLHDTEGPEVDAPDDFTATTSGTTCETSVVIPPAVVSDNCNALDRYVVSSGAQFESSPTVVPVTLDLIAGTHTVYIEAFDACGNSGIDSLEVTVEDNTNPVAICDQNTVVSLTNNGEARIYATTFDDGSYDECGIDSISVRRMDDDCDGTPSEFRSYVEFCCDDVANSPIIVVFRVTDLSGNTNDCMVNVTVQDKLDPTLRCPSEIVVSCEYPIDVNDMSEFGSVVYVQDLNDLNNPDTDPREDIIINDPDNTEFQPQPYNWGKDGYIHDNCFATVDDEVIDNRDNCGVGVINRVFTARDGAGNVVGQCTQEIYVYNFNPFNSRTIDWPEDLTISDNCSGDEYTPDFIEDNYGSDYSYPQFDEGICDQVGWSYNDMVFTYTDPEQSACYMIMRTWKMLNWCNPEAGTVTHEQIIKVMNTVAPTFTSDCSDQTLYSNDADCDSRFVELIAEAEDDCTPADELYYQWTIELFGDPTNTLSGVGNDASDDYPLGMHHISWIVEDRCGNSTLCEYDFTISNEKAPSPVCLNGLSAELMPIDSDGDGVPDQGMLELSPDYFDGGSFHACGFDFTLSFSSDPNDVTLMLDCDDVGQLEVELWAHASNGTSDYCRTYLLVQANQDQCGTGNNGPAFPIGGMITGLTSEGIPTVAVDLEGSTVNSESQSDGSYGFNPMPEGGAYTVVPTLDKDHLNGVTTWDLTMIQRHVLGISEINDPYKLIAADINNDMAITGKDLTVLRRIILGLDENFRNNTSWRFVDKAYNFVTTDPLHEDFPEEYEIPELNNSMNNVDFLGVKVGDVNNSVDVKGMARGRSDKTNIIAATDQRFMPGDQVRLQVTSEMMKSLDAMQFTLTFDADALNFMDVEAGALSLADNNVAVIRDGVLTTSWNSALGAKLENGEVLFTMIFSAEAGGSLSTAINLNSSVTPALTYVDGEESGLSLEFRRDGVATVNYALFQNTPNPASEMTIIEFTLPKDSDATISIFDLDGKTVKLAKGQYDAGFNQEIFNVKDLSSGVYYYTLKAGEFTATKKMLVIE